MTEIKRNRSRTPDDLEGRRWHRNSTVFIYAARKVHSCGFARFVSYEPRQSSRLFLERDRWIYERCNAQCKSFFFSFFTHIQALSTRKRLLFAILLTTSRILRVTSYTRATTTHPQPATYWLVTMGAIGFTLFITSLVRILRTLSANKVQNSH
jgi:hypothetical protein